LLIVRQLSSDSPVTVNALILAHVTPGLRVVRTVGFRGVIHEVVVVLVGHLFA
jgi:hypothetical protein